MIEVLLLAVALAMDAAAVAAGIAASQRSWRPVLLAASSFGVFQAGMAGLGWWGGAWLTGWASAWDHWIAFTLLAGIGGRMVWQALGAVDDEERAGRGALTLPTLLTLSFATSIDALAAGVSLPMMPLGGHVSVAVIGLVTAACSAMAGAVARWLARVGSHLEVAGGVVLVLLGVKVLAEHLGLFGS